jgi:X-X-X-Leu-X-X-Gly heptad repeat protein
MFLSNVALRTDPPPFVEPETFEIKSVADWPSFDDMTHNDTSSSVELKGNLVHPSATDTNDTDASALKESLQYILENAGLVSDRIGMLNERDALAAALVDGAAALADGAAALAGGSTALADDAAAVADGAAAVGGASAAVGSEAAVDSKAMNASLSITPSCPLLPVPGLATTAPAQGGDASRSSLPMQWGLGAEAPVKDPMDGSKRARAPSSQVEKFLVECHSQLELAEHCFNNREFEAAERARLRLIAKIKTAFADDPSFGSCDPSARLRIRSMLAGSHSFRVSRDPCYTCHTLLSLVGFFLVTDRATGTNGPSA